jgi:beta-phosphoglucomutase-like phosphatase (HAD superfamily)
MMLDIGLDGTRVDSTPFIAWALIDTLSQYEYQTTLDELTSHFRPSMPQTIQQATGFPT